MMMASVFQENWISASSCLEGHTVVCYVVIGLVYIHIVHELPALIDPDRQVDCLQQFFKQDARILCRLMTTLSL